MTWSSPPLRALTLTQPWATLVAIGAKEIETRSWGTSYRGALAIHAAAGLGPVGGLAGLAALTDSEPFFEALRPHLSGYTAKERVCDLPRGCIVAVARLVDVVPTGSINFAMNVVGIDLPARVEQERAFGDYTPGRHAWLLDRTLHILDPIPCRGHLGLWNVPPDTRAHLEDIIDLHDLSAHHQLPLHPEGPAPAASDGVGRVYAREEGS
jgi:hypothetical protein